MARALVLVLAISVSGVARADEVSPPRRFDLAIGLAYVTRSLSFDAAPDLADRAASYRGSLQGGALFDATLYPLAFVRAVQTSALAMFGLEVVEEAPHHFYSARAGAENLPTTASRFSAGPVFRLPVDHTLVLGARAFYSSQVFAIAQTFAGNMATDIPNVHYSLLEPQVYAEYALGTRVILHAGLGADVPLVFGGIQANGATGYGPTTGYGVEAEAGIDVRVSDAIFLRARASMEEIEMRFSGSPYALSNTRDMDPDRDVAGASDRYTGINMMIGLVL
jgi:hypothetical protein